MNMPRAPISVSGQQTALAVVQTVWVEEIQDMATRAIVQAIIIDGPVKFDFNGDIVICVPTDTPEQVEALYLQVLDDRRAAWEASPEGQARAEQDRQDLIADQAELDDLLRQLPGQVDQGLSATLDWLALFIPVADHDGLEWDMAATAELLERIASANMHVGGAELTGRCTASAEYIVGQAVDHLRRGVPPYRMLGDFIQEWRGS